MEPLSGDVTRLLLQIREGKKEAKEQLLILMYDEIYRIAKIFMWHERQNHTLQPTALVNEAYIKLVEKPQQCWESRAHFKAVCARIIRNFLVDYARKRNAGKRGGDIEFVPLEESVVGSKEWPIEDTLAFYEAMDRLEKTDPRRCQIVELSFFGQMTEDEIAHVLGISDRTVTREKEKARAWLFAELHKK
jgi:RNA polymerase sigma factor (TIGR02999 family)